MNYGREMTQINDALTQTAACGGAVAYDKSNGLVFVSYMTGLRKRYGESTGRVCLSVFSPEQSSDTSLAFATNPHLRETKKKPKERSNCTKNPL